MPVLLCAGATCVKKNCCLVSRIVPFDTADLYLLTSKDIALDPSHVISH